MQEQKHHTGSDLKRVQDVFEIKSKHQEKDIARLKEQIYQFEFKIKETQDSLDTSRQNQHERDVLSRVTDEKLKAQMTRKWKQIEALERAITV